MIPSELKKELQNDSFMEKCVVTGHRPVQWHHPFIFAGKSIQERWAIVPVTKKIHDKCTQHKPEYTKETDERVQLIALNRATLEELHKYSKVNNLFDLRARLRDKYGK